MKINSQLKGGIYEVSFGYHSKLDGYATLMSDIPKLCEMLGRLNINIMKLSNNPKNFDFTNAIKRGSLNDRN